MKEMQVINTSTVCLRPSSTLCDAPGATPMDVTNKMKDIINELHSNPYFNKYHFSLGKTPCGITSVLFSCRLPADVKSISSSITSVSLSLSFISGVK